MSRKEKHHPVVKVRETKQILTNEDWYPTVEGKVGASLIGWDNGTWRVCVWGGDDTGMELDTDEGRARWVFSRIVDLTTVADLKALGLKPA